MNPAITVVEFQYTGRGHAIFTRALSGVFALTIVSLTLFSAVFLLQFEKQSAALFGALRGYNMGSAIAPIVQFPQKFSNATSAVLSASTTVKQNDEALNKLINDFAASHSGTFRVATIDLSHAEKSTSYGGDADMTTASTYKMFAAYVSLLKVEQGKLSLDTSISGGTLGLCVQRMIQISDNACGEAVGNKIGWAEMTKIANAAGFRGTSLDGTKGGLVSTANDEAQFLADLYNGKLLNAEHTQYLLDLMKTQVYRTGIPAGTEGVVVANKVGNLGTFHNDAAIVYGAKTKYVLVILTDRSNINAIKDLSKQVYSFYNP